MSRFFEFDEPDCAMLYYALINIRSEYLRLVANAKFYTEERQRTNLEGLKRCEALINSLGSQEEKQNDGQ